MDSNPNDQRARPTTDQVELLTDSLRDDLFELVDGLFPLDIVNHVMCAVFMLESLSGVAELGTAAPSNLRKPAK